MSHVLKMLITILGATFCNCASAQMPFQCEQNLRDGQVVLGAPHMASINLGTSPYGGDTICLRFSDFFYSHRAQLGRARCNARIMATQNDPYALIFVSAGNARDWLHLGSGEPGQIEARRAQAQESCEQILAYVREYLKVR